MKYARIIDSTVVDVCSDPTGCFHPTLALEFVQVPDSVERGWVVVNDSWSAPPPPPKPEMQRKALTRIEFELHVQTSAGLTDTQFFAAIQDQNLALMWHRLSSGEALLPTGELTHYAIATMVAAEYLTAEQGDAVLATWPTE